MSPEFSRPLALAAIPASGVEREVSADAAECAVLAQRLHVPAVAALACRWRLLREPGGGVFAEATLRAQLTLVCVVTLEPFETAIAEAFAVRFLPADELGGDSGDPLAIDEIPFDGTAIDLGEAAAEQLALVLPAFPRGPDADAALPSSDDETPGAFAALAALRRVRH
jgi:uncharacterized metal-binding protein YceD (DUF177 family)